MNRVKHSIFTAIFIATALTFFSSCEAAQAHEKKAMELGPAAGTWIKLQNAYMFETGKVGNCEQISYKLPENGKTEVFTYSCRLENDIAYWTAENYKNLGKCPAGNQWILLMKSGDDEPEVHLPKNKSCQELTLRLMPSFSSLGKVKE